MKRSLFGGLALALLAMPLFSLFGSPSPSSRAPDLASLVSFKSGYELTTHDMKEKRPWLNPARAALRI